MSRFSQRIGEKSRANDVLTGRRYAVDRPIVIEPRTVLILDIEH